MYKKRNQILDDFKKIANSLRMIILETKGDKLVKVRISVLVQHLDKLYEDIKELVDDKENNSS